MTAERVIEARQLPGLPGRYETLKNVTQPVIHGEYEQRVVTNNAAKAPL